MTPLQQRMIEDIQLRGLSERTREAYVRAVRQLAEHYHTSPAHITEEALRDYFLYLKNVKHSSRSASTIALCGIKFFYEHTLKREWSTLTCVRAPREKKLPVILSVEEVRTLLAHLKLLRYRACLTTIYSCGLRLQEGTHLQGPDMDSARMVVHVRSGKGAKDRSVPLPHAPWSSCASTGKRTAIPPGSSPLQVVAVSVCLPHRLPCHATGCRMPSGEPSRPVGSTSVLQYTP